jgi:hypothetical protein
VKASGEEAGPISPGAGGVLVGKKAFDKGVGPISPGAGGVFVGVMGSIPTSNCPQANAAKINTNNTRTSLFRFSNIINFSFFLVYLLRIRKRI